MILLKSYQLLT